MEVKFGVDREELVQRLYGVGEVLDLLAHEVISPALQDLESDEAFLETLNDTAAEAVAVGSVEEVQLGVTWLLSPTNARGEVAGLLREKWIESLKRD